MAAQVKTDKLAAFIRKVDPAAILLKAAPLCRACRPLSLLCFLASPARAKGFRGPIGDKHCAVSPT